MGQKGSLWGNLLLVASFLVMVAALYMVFLWAPTEQTMGQVQRIFYFHVASAWVAFLAFFVVFVGSLAYLWKGKTAWDHLAVSSAELGVIFTTVAIAAGSLWAKPVWGVWWTWDPRLTTTLVIWFIYVAYLLVRAYTEEPSRQARFAAIVGIIGFLDVPLVFMSIRWWRTIHPEPVVLGSPGSGLAPEMTLTLVVSLIALTFLYALLLWRRFSLERLAEKIARLRGKIN